MSYQYDAFHPNVMIRTNFDFTINSLHKNKQKMNLNYCPSVEMSVILSVNFWVLRKILSFTQLFIF